MATTKKPVLLIDRPISEIVDLAHSAGAAATFPEMIRHAMLDTRSSWLVENLPEAPVGMDDDAFNEIQEAAAEAFFAGMDISLVSYYRDIQSNIERLERSTGSTAVDDRLLPSEEAHAITLATAEAAGAEFGSTRLQNLAVAEFLKTVPDQYEGQTEDEYDDFVQEAKARFVEGFARAFEPDPDDECNPVRLMLGNVTSMLETIWFLASREKGHGDTAIIAKLASIAAEVCADASRFLEPEVPESVPRETAARGQVSASAEFEHA